MRSGGNTLPADSRRRQVLLPNPHKAAAWRSVRSAATAPPFRRCGGRVTFPLGESFAHSIGKAACNGIGRAKRAFGVGQGDE